MKLDINISNCSRGFYKYEFRKNCFERCPNKSIERKNSKELEIFKLDKQFFCKPICNESFSFEIILDQECVSDCELDSLLNYSCILNYQDGKSNTKIFDVILGKINDLFISDDYNTSEIENGKDVIFKYENMKVTFTTLKNQKNDEKNGNVSTIDLGDCERILKEIYNISRNETLFLVKIEVFQKGMLIPKIEYDVYYKLNGVNLVKLNLSYCKNVKIDISVPIQINIKNIDQYNSSSCYYNDICYVTTSDSGTDITLKDRKKEFIDKNKTLCQENCFLTNYDYNINKARCSCEVIESSSKFENIKIDKEKLYKNFIDIKNIANVYFLLCYKVLFSKKGLIKNYGSYSIIIIIIVHLIIIIVYYSLNLYKQVLNIIRKISFCSNNYEFLKLLIKRGRNKKILNQKKKNVLKRNKVQKFENEKNRKSEIKMDSKSTFGKTINLNYPIEETKEFSKKAITLNKKLSTQVIDEISKDLKNVMEYNDEELNSLEYDLALKHDKRNYCQYYISLLKTKHSLIFTFFNNNDYNLKIIKIDLFLFNFSLFYVINALFFNDDTMHKIYINNGDFGFIGQLPQIIYSYLISSLFSFILEMLALTEEVIIQMKKIVFNIQFNKRILDLSNKIKIKIFLYFIISTIFLIFFWYYLSMFCAIYPNTQIHLIKDTLLSFVVSFIEPLGLFLIPGLLRFLSLSKQNNNRGILYKLSQILQKIVI